MSKQYKLIKEFPGSPKVGHIIQEYKEKDYKNFYYSICEDNNCCKLSMYHSENIVKYPEFWQKIK